jgi:hypothetical protein
LVQGEGSTETKRPLNVIKIHLCPFTFFSPRLKDDHKAFRRQLEDKRPIVESNLMSGRQYVASEPPLSDTSDSEGLFNGSVASIVALIFPLLTAFDAESRFLSAEDQNRELTRSIRREVAKLTEQWNHLINRSDGWKHRLDEYMTVSFGLHLLPRLHWKFSHTSSSKVFTFNRGNVNKINFSRRHLEWLIAARWNESDESEREKKREAPRDNPEKLLW